MTSLSSQQEAIVKAPIGEPMRVLATAGSGKTRVLTERVRFIVQNTKRDGVIALTFTNKAADEMRSRLEDVGDLEDRCWITTIHAWAERMLTQYSKVIGLPGNLQIFDREEDRKIIFIKSLQEENIDVDKFFGAKNSAERNKKIQGYLEQIAALKRKALFNDEEIKNESSYYDGLYDVYKAYQRALVENGGIDFDDILVYASQILNQEPRVGEIYRAKYKHICVDEAQDLNHAQYKLIKTFCSEQIKSVLMVGDENQMIYGFNGSSRDFLCGHFISDFSPNEYTLPVNYRSSKAVIGLANKLKLDSQYGTNYAFTGIADIKSFIDENEEAGWICEKIQELLALKHHKEIEGSIDLTRMAVLGRTRFVFSEIEKHLQTKNIAYSLKKGERVANPVSIIGKTVFCGIRLKVNPKNDIAKTQLEAIRKEKRENQEILTIQSKILALINKLDSNEPNINKFYNDLKEILKPVSCSKGIGILEEDELKENLQEIDEFWRYWLLFRKKGLGKSLVSFCNALSLGELTEHVEQHGLTLSTIHTMKGLEKDIIFLMGMCEGVFPDYRANTQAQREEELNNAFVAVTRAKRWLYITYPERRLMPWGDIKTQQPSRFILTMENSRKNIGSTSDYLTTVAKFGIAP